VARATLPPPSQPPALLGRRDSDASVVLGTTRIRSGPNDAISPEFDPETTVDVFADDSPTATVSAAAGGAAASSGGGGDFYKSRIGMSLAEWMNSMDGCVLLLPHSVRDTHRERERDCVCVRVCVCERECVQVSGRVGGEKMLRGERACVG
jgi:hypothetical protein